MVKVDVFNPWLDPDGGDLTEDGEGLNSSASATRGALCAVLRFAHGVDAAQCAKACVIDGGARAAAELALLAPALLPSSASGALVAAAADALCAAINLLGESECLNCLQHEAAEREIAMAWALAIVLAAGGDPSPSLRPGTSGVGLLPMTATVAARLARRSESAARRLMREPGKGKDSLVIALRRRRDTLASLWRAAEPPPPTRSHSLAHDLGGLLESERAADVVPREVESR